MSAEGDDTRPGRAYSLGSKPPDTQLTTTPENRQRACSVGSKNYKKYFNRVSVVKVFILEYQYYLRALKKVNLTFVKLILTVNFIIELKVTKPQCQDRKMAGDIFFKGAVRISVYFIKKWSYGCQRKYF